MVEESLLHLQLKHDPAIFIGLDAINYPHRYFEML